MTERDFSKEALERMTARLVALAQRLEKEADPAMRDLADDLALIWNDQDPA